jgi:hypothetical protein
MQIKFLKNKKNLITIFITIFITILLLVVVPLLVLYNNGTLPYLDFETILLLLKNKINIFKMVVNDSQPCGGPNSISSGDLQLLIEELKDL